MIGQNYINGEFVSSASNFTFDNIDPCTEESLGSFAIATTQEVDEEYDVARKTFHSWREVSRV